ncbi:TPA: hypothetical protein IAD41_05580 [Candidatus Scatenecus faecavium]|uniref:Uncharacterized protein n=1 Tax=Candidatus Scatenecus faecavium TaxID=2840915 RepID=A0A9D1FWK9_9BACT|nr:hypothetical protein [Candidatus Scatenecus faecavium]
MLKNVFLSSLITIFLVQPVLAFGTYKKLNFNDDKPNPQASKILYEYVLKSQNMSPAEIKDLAGIEPKSAKAFEVDLNEDGIKEIIGLVYSTFYWGTAGYSLFILQKQPNGYKDISTLVFEPQEIVDIRSEKTNGYHDIKLTGSNGDNVQYVAKYKDGMYQWAYKQ